MRDFIMGHRQEVLLQLGIDAQDLLLLDYLIKFFESGCAYTRRFDDGFYFNISLSKVVEDMPFVVKSEKRLRERFAQLEQKGVIKRLTYCNQSFVCVNFEYLYHGKNKDGDIPPSFSEMVANYGHSDGDIPPTIIKYIKNKIYIYYNLNKRVPECEINDEEFFKKLKIELFSTMSEASYNICISKAQLRCISPHLIVLDVKYSMPAVKKFHTKTIENAVNKVLKSCGLIV